MKTAIVTEVELKEFKESIEEATDSRDLYDYALDFAKDLEKRLTGEPYVEEMTKDQIEAALGKKIKIIG